MERFIVRAEIETATEHVVSYGYDLSPSSVFVVTDWPAALGARVVLRLSLPRVAPVQVAARVADLQAQGAPGELAGVKLELEPPESGGENAALANLLAAASVPGRGGTYRALIVEDNGLTRDVIQFRARSFFGDVAVSHAETAEQAWELLAANPYDVVLVDYFLPNGDGASLITRLRADRRLRGTLVVAISAGGRVAREATLGAGADLFVDKPLVFRDLFRTLQILAGTAPDPGKRTILVLDDSALALAVTRAALEKAGFTVAIAEDLVTFERQRTSVDPDLILVDVQMPEAYGDDVAATLVGGKGVAVPIVLFSSIDEEELAQRTALANVSAYVWKGAGMTELVKRCKELLEPSRVIQEPNA